MDTGRPENRVLDLKKILPYFGKAYMYVYSKGPNRLYIGSGVLHGNAQ